MKEQLISFETAKLAKEKGFDNPVYWHYWLENNNWILKGNSFLVREVDVVMNKDEGKNGIEVSVEGDRLFRNYTWKDSKYLKESECPFIATPTQSLLQKWLREVHKINVESNFISNIQKYRSLFKPMGIIPKSFSSYSEFINNINKYYGTTDYDSYEEALEEGLQEALKLINSLTEDK